MTQPRIVVVGSANMDLVASAPRLPRPGETVLGGAFTMVPGGKGANQAVAVARAGGRCVFVGAVGTDPFADTLRGQLRAAGVDDQWVRVSDGPSGVALIVVDASGENTIVVAPGANATLTGIHSGERTAIVAADVLMCQLEVPVDTVTQAARIAGDNGVPVVLNAAPARPLPAELTVAVDVLVVNEGEARAIAGGGVLVVNEGEARAIAGGGVSDVDSLLDALVGLVPTVVLTLGAAGVAYADREGVRLRVPAPVVSAVDTTAAGDAFVGAFAVAWARRRPVAEVLRWACAAGAVCAGRRGASSALPTHEEIDALYVSWYRPER
jgi:ribokinase